ncbi:MAG: pantetheine-phosphate adenylyltransferase [Rhodospirillaceae bacterium]|nr:pantetheine-phosphate adenylyltransferase [Rhodospirillaceae bacterium]
MARDRIGIYPGTFDPITNGHVDIIRRALRICDQLIVGVAENIGKNPLFSLEERVSLVNHELDLINQATGGGQASTRVFGNLLMHFVEETNAVMIIRGLRAVSDFDYEFQMAGMNARLNPNIEMVYLMASEHQQFIASRLVKEIAAMGGDITSFVPQNTCRALAAKFS